MNLFRLSRHTRNGLDDDWMAYHIFRAFDQLFYKYFEVVFIQDHQRACIRSQPVRLSHVVKGLEKEAVGDFLCTERLLLIAIEFS